MKKTIAVLLVAVYLSQSWAFAAPSRLFQRRAADFELLPGSSLEELERSLDKNLGRSARKQWLEELSQRKISPSQSNQENNSQNKSLVSKKNVLPTGTTPEFLPAQDIKVVTTDKYHEIANGLTGVRVAKQDSFSFTTRSRTLAPVQAIEHADGMWSND